MFKSNATLSPVIGGRADDSDFARGIRTLLQVKTADLPKSFNGFWAADEGTPLAQNLATLRATYAEMKGVLDDKAMGRIELSVEDETLFFNEREAAANEIAKLEGAAKSKERAKMAQEIVKVNAKMHGRYLAINNLVDTVNGASVTVGWQISIHAKQDHTTVAKAKLAQIREAQKAATESANKKS